MEPFSSKKQSLIAELAPFSDHHERFQYIIDRAKLTPPLPSEFKLDAFLVEGCTSNLWLVPSLHKGICHFRCDADSLITKGIACLVCEFFDGTSPHDVTSINADFLSDVGITQHLSPNRRNGLSNLIQKIHSFAVASKPHC